MKTIVIAGWKPGFRKVQFTEFLRHEFGYSLAEAKRATDHVIENDPLQLGATEADSVRLLSQLDQLGARVAMETDQDASAETNPTRDRLRPSA